MALIRPQDKKAVEPKKKSPEGSKLKHMVKGRKKLDLQRLIYCQASTTWTGIYHQGHSQVEAFFTIEKGVMCRANPEPTVRSDPVPTVGSTGAKIRCISSLPLLLGLSWTTLLHSHLGLVFLFSKFYFNTFYWSIGDLESWVSFRCTAK